MDRVRRAHEIARLLRQEYPGAACELRFGNPWELLVATILSAQCTDERVNQVTPELFRRWPGPAELAAAPLEEIEEVIRPTGFFRNKARAIQGAARVLVAEHGGEVPRELEAMVRLPGVGRKTANVVLGEAYGIPAGIAVDTHVKRLAGRLGLTSESNPGRIERDLMELFPRERWTPLAHILIHHGRRVCGARKPRCAECVVAHLCPSSTV